MGKIVVTGATGRLGGAAVRYLLEKGVPAEQIAVIARDPQKAAEFADLGMEVRKGDYDDPASLVPAFADAAKLLFVSSPLLDNTARIRQHASVAEAARNAGVGHIIYTGFAFAELMHIGLENVHLATEYMLRTTGIPFTLLRNGFYSEILIHEGLKSIVEQGELITTAAAGAFNYVSRDNLALAAAVVLAEAGHENKSYNLTSPKPMTFEEFAALLTEISGKPVKVNAVSPEEGVEKLVQSGLPAGLAGFLVHVVDRAVAGGQFSHTSDDLLRLIGGQYTPVREEVERVLQSGR